MGLACRAYTGKYNALGTAEALVRCPLYLGENRLDPACAADVVSLHPAAQPSQQPPIVLDSFGNGAADVAQNAMGAHAVITLSWMGPASSGATGPKATLIVHGGQGCYLVRDGSSSGGEPAFVPLPNSAAVALVHGDLL